MSARVSVANHTPGGHRLLVEVFHVDICGQVLETPRLAQHVSPGVTSIIELRGGDVLTVREATDALDEPDEDDTTPWRTERTR